MVERHLPDESGNDDLTKRPDDAGEGDASAEKGSINDRKTTEAGGQGSFGQRSLLKLPAASGGDSSRGDSGNGDGDGSNLDRSLVIDGADGRSDYSFTVTGELAENDAVGSLESVDTVRGGTVSGTADVGDADGFRFSGNVTSFRLDGEASVVFEDNDG